MSAQTSGDVSLIKDEDVLRKMWQDAEDFGRKKEIRAHMYKLREARLRDFYNSGEVSSDIQRTSTITTESKTCSGSTHADSLADHSFISMKTKEIRDSESPTKDDIYRIADKGMGNQGWTVVTSNNKSEDGKTHTTKKVATTSGSDKIQGGQINYAAKNEQQASVFKDGDDKNFTKAVGASSNTVIRQDASGVDENSSFRSSSTTTSSSSKFVSEQRSSSEVQTPARMITQNQKEVVSTKTFTDNIPSELKNHPSYVEGKTKVTRETRTLPDGSTVTTTRYEIKGDATKKSSQYSTSSSEQKSSSSSVVRSSQESKTSQNEVKTSKYVSEQPTTITMEIRGVSDTQIQPATTSTISRTVRTHEVSNGSKKIEPTVTVTKTIVCDSSEPVLKTSEVTTHSDTKRVTQRAVNEATTQSDTKRVTQKDINEAFIDVERRDTRNKMERQPSPEKQKFTSPERRQPIKPGKSELDERPKATEGQYDTTYRSDFTNKRISVDVSPTHEAFARSLRAVSPDRASNLRTSTSSLRSSTSPEKNRHPSRVSPERRSVSPKKTFSTETITKCRSNEIDSSTLTRRQKRPTRSRSPSPTTTASDIEFIRTNIITDLDTNVTTVISQLRPSALEITTKKKITERSPTSPLTESPKKSPRDVARTNSLRSISPTKEGHVKPDRPFKRTDTYEERCRQILGITNETSKKKTDRRMSGEKKSPERRKSPEKRSPIKDTSKISEFPSQIRRSPEKRVPETYPEKRSPIKDVSKINEFPSQIRKSPEKRVPEPYPEKKSPVKDVSKISEFPAQIRKSPEKRVLEPYPERKSPVKDASKINEFPSQIRKSPEKRVPEPYPEKKSPVKDVSKICEFPSQIRKSPEKRVPEPYPERKSSLKEPSKISEFPSQIRISPEKEPWQAYPERKSPSKEAPKINEFPSQIRRSPEKEPLEPYPEKKSPLKDVSKISEFPSQIRKKPEKEPLEPYSEKKGPSKDKPSIDEFPCQIRRTPEREPLGPYPTKESPAKESPKISEFPAQIRKSPERKLHEKYPEISITDSELIKESSSDEEVFEEVNITKLSDLEGKVPANEPLVTKKFIQQLCKADEIERSDLTTNSSVLKKEVLETGKKPNATVKKSSPKRPEELFIANEKKTEKKNYSPPKVSSPTKKPLSEKNVVNNKKVVTKVETKLTKRITETKPKEVKKTEKITLYDIENLNKTKKDTSVHVRTNRVDDTVNRKKTTVKVELKQPVRPCDKKPQKTLSKTKIEPVTKRVTTTTTPKRHVVSTTITVTPTKAPKTKPKPKVQNGHISSDEESITDSLNEDTRKEKVSRVTETKKKTQEATKKHEKCITTKSIVINNESNEREVIVDLQRSKSSREPTPDRICPLPVSSDDDTTPRYPDKIAEPDDFISRRKPKKISDIPESEDVKDFSSVTEVTKDDECLLSVSEKVNKFITTAEQLTAPQDLPTRPKSPKCQYYENDVNVSDKVAHFITTADKVITTPKGPAPKVERPAFDVDETMKEDECLLSVSDKVSKFITTAEKLTDAQAVSLSKIDEKRRSPSKETTPTRRPSGQTSIPETRYPRRDSSPKLPDSTPRRPSDEAPRSVISPTGRLRSTESVKKAKALFENITNDQKVLKQRDILSRPSVFEGRKLKAEAARKLQYEDDRETSKSPDRTLRRSQSPEGDLPGYMKPLDRSLRPNSPHRDNINQLKKQTVKDEETSCVTKFGVTLRRTDSGRVVSPTTKRVSVEITETEIEEIYSLQVLEELLESVVSYELRRKIRGQIRLVKQLISEGKLEETIKKTKKVETSYSERRMSSEVTKRRTSSPTKVRTPSPTKVTRSQSPEKAKPSREKSPEKQSKFQLKKITQTSKVSSDDTPEWVKQRNLRKVTQSSVTTSKTSTTTTKKTRKSPEKEVKPTDIITSSYGVGPTDENGSPLFGLKALRVNKSDSTKVQGTVIRSQYYSENGEEPVGEISVTKYSTDPRDLGRNDVKTKGVTSVTTTQKFGYKDTPSLTSLTKKKKEICEEETKSTKFNRRGSVKALSQKFIENTVETLKNERQTSYPKAGLILRTSSFKESASSGDSREGSTERTTIKSSSRTSESFLTNRSKVTGVQDVISRMKTEDIREGDSAEDVEARGLLNKFLGAQVILSGIEANVKTSTTSSARRSTKVTTTVTESGKPVTKTRVFQHPITDEVLQTVWDEQTLRLLLEQSSDYEERRRIRARLRQVMAEQEACTELVEKASQDQIATTFEGESQLLPLLQGLLEAPDNEQTADSGTESGEDQRSGLIAEVQNALDKLSANLRDDATDITPERRSSLLQLVTKLQVGLAASVPAQERRSSVQGRFRRRQRPNRHTVGVSSEELADARRLIEEISSHEITPQPPPKLSMLQKQNSEGCVGQNPNAYKSFLPQKSVVKNAVAKPFSSSNSTVSGNSSSVQTPTEPSEGLDLLFNEEEKKPEFTYRSISLDDPSVRRSSSGDVSIHSVQNAIKQAAARKSTENLMESEETDEDTTMKAQTVKPEETGKPEVVMQSNPIYQKFPSEDKTNKFNTKKLKMKRANTIDIPKPLNFYEDDDDSDCSLPEEDYHQRRRSNYLALRGPIRVGNVGEKKTLPVFEPKTDNDKKFLAFINKHNENDSKNSIWSTSGAPKATVWSNKFGNIKTAFETATFGQNSARQFWKCADDTVNSGPKYDGPKISKQSARNLRQMFEEKQKQSQKAPWSGDKNVVTGSLKVKAFEPHNDKTYKFVPQPLPVNKFSHAPQSAFKPIPKKVPPLQLHKTTLKPNEKGKDLDSPLYLYSPKPSNESPSKPWLSNPGESRVLNLAASKFENVTPPEPVAIKPRKLSKDKVLMPFQQQQEKLSAPYLVKSADQRNSTVKQLSGQYDNTGKNDGYATYSTVKYTTPQAEEKVRSQYDSHRQAQPQLIRNYDQNARQYNNQGHDAHYQPQHQHQHQHQDYRQKGVQHSNQQFNHDYEHSRSRQHQHYVSQQYKAPDLHDQHQRQHSTQQYNYHHDSPKTPIDSQYYSNYQKQPQQHFHPQPSPDYAKDYSNYSRQESLSKQRDSAYQNQQSRVPPQDYRQESQVPPQNYRQEPQVSPQNYRQEPQVPPQTYQQEPQVQPQAYYQKQFEDPQFTSTYQYRPQSSTPPVQSHPPKLDSQVSVESVHEYNAVNSRVMAAPVSQQATTVRQKSPMNRNEHDMAAALNLRNALQKVSSSPPKGAPSPNYRSEDNTPSPQPPKIMSPPHYRVSPNSFSYKPREEPQKLVSPHSFSYKSKETPSTYKYNEINEINDYGESVVTSKFQIPVINVPESPRPPSQAKIASKADSWNQICMQNQQPLHKPSPRASPNARTVSKSKSSHSLALPKQFEAGMTKDEMSQKRRTMEAFLTTGSKSPQTLSRASSNENLSVKCDTKVTKRAINRVKTSEKVSTYRHSSGLSRSRTLPDIVCPELLDEGNVDKAFEELFKSST